MNIRNCPQFVINQANTSLVRPILEYVCCVWDSYQCKHIKQLESVQRHAARFPTENYHSMNPWCVANIVIQLSLDLLEHRRAKRRITVLCKIINNLVEMFVLHRLKVSVNSTPGSATHKFRQLNKKLNCY